jgi:signal transduction histidine kinase
VILAVMTIITITFHYQGMHHSDLALRGLLRQFCYLPILAAALWFGLRGGLINAAAITVIVAPSIYLHHMGASDAAQEGLEYFYYFLFGSVFGWLSDRERRAQLEQAELTRRLERMEHLSEIGELAAGLAHEIKNPMGSIKGAAEIIAPGFKQDDPKREFAFILIEEVNRLNRVVEDFLRYAKPLALSKKTARLKDMIERMTKQVAMAAEGKGIEVNIEADPGLTAFADEEKLMQVFMNLALNACQAMKGQGRLRIAASRERDGGARIEFSDTGPGIPADQRRRIFMPFHTSKPDGAGLGLTVSERIVAAHGGRIEVGDSPKGGAVFAVVLPGEAG